MNATVANCCLPPFVNPLSRVKASATVPKASATHTASAMNAITRPHRPQSNSLMAGS